MDLHILCLDYRGFGDSAGYPSETGVVADSIFLFNYIKKLAGENYIFIWGHSMGTKELSVKHTPPTGLILEAPFNNAIDLITQSPESAAWRWTPWFNAPMNHILCLRYGYRITCPILIMHAVDDEVISISLAKKLRDAALSANRDVKFIAFSSGRGLLHKHINRALELPLILKFVSFYASINLEVRYKK
uniref:Lysophosphatidylserine lipase ABHD12 n=1 Tax=Elaeophora elaphi TaxID=1147741 RepID=A0A0R3RSQ8_9BILA